MRSWLTILAIALLMPLGPRPAQAQSKPSSVLDFDLWFDEWVAENISLEALLDPARELPPEARGEKSVEIRSRLKRAFRGEEKALTVFSGKASLRSDVLILLGELGRPFTSRELISFLPEAHEVKGFDRQLIQTSELTAFAQFYWSKACSERIQVLLQDEQVIGQPEDFLALCYLGLQATEGTLQTQLDPLIQQAYFQAKKSPSETTIVTLYRALAHSRWSPKSADAATAAIGQTSTATMRRLAKQLRELTIEEFLPPTPAKQTSQPEEDSSPEEKQLTAQDFKALAGFVSQWDDWVERHASDSWDVSGWEGWTLKLALQAKSPNGRNTRVAQFLADVVAEEGDHYRLFDNRGGIPDNGLVSNELDIDYFMWLHGAAEHPGAWSVMGRSPGNLRQTVSLLHGFFDAKLQDRWPVGLLDLLRAKYYDLDDEAFLKTLRVISRGAEVLSGNGVRRRLLQWVHDGEFPAAWDQRWTLAFEAADGAKLLDEIPLESQTCSALELLTTVCLQQPLSEESATALEQVNETCGQLLTRIHRALFSDPQEATLADEAGKHIMKQLGDLFKQLARLRAKHEWEATQLDGVNGFYDKVRNTFEQAARSNDRPRMALSLVLLLRIAGLLGDPTQVKELADSVAGEMFGIADGATYRVISRDIAKRDAELFRQIAPAIVDAVEAVARETEFDKAEGKARLDMLTKLFEDKVYLPLLKSTYFLDAVGAGSECPWIELAASYSTVSQQKAAWRRLIHELTRAPFLSSHGGTVSLLHELSKEDRLAIRVWLRPPVLGGNITVPVLKALLDAQHEDRHHPDARVDRIVRLIIGKHGTGQLWWLEASYGQNQITPLKALNPRDLLKWHEGMVTFHESRAAPFRGKLADAELIHAYDALHGPRFELPKGKYTRTGIPGDLRLYLIDRMRELAKRTDAPLAWRLDVAQLALLLPNRQQHIRSGEKLTDYHHRKQQLMSEWESLLTENSSSGDLETQILRFLIRLRYSFSPPLAEAAGSAAAVARRRLKQSSDRQDDYRALIREEAFLRYINGSGGISPDADAQAKTLLDYARAASAAIDEASRRSSPASTLDRLQHAASYSRQLFDRLEDSDVVLFAPLLETLEHDRVSAASSYRILIATAQMLPWYGVSAERFILPEGFDGVGNRLASAPSSINRDALVRRLLFFSLLSGEVRRRLVEHAINPQSLEDPDDVRLLRRLLLDANTIGTLLAGQVFRNPTLLKEVYRDRELSYDTLNFEILYTHAQTVTINARDLLDSAVKGCELNFQLLNEMPQGMLPDNGVIDFMVPVVRKPEKPEAAKESIATKLKRRGRRASQPLDEVLRTLVTIHHDDRYDEEQDEEVRRAVKEFKTSAKSFIDNPTRGLIWFQDGGAGFQLPETYFRAADAVIRNIEQRPFRITTVKSTETGGAEAASRDYEALWSNLLFAAAGQDQVAWQRKFVDLFCTVGAPKLVGNAAQSLPNRLKFQRELVFTLLLGEKAGTASARPLDGIAHNLAELKGMSKGDRGETFRRRYWESSRAVIQAALIGKGARVGKPVFPTYLFVNPATRKIQPISEEGLSSALQDTDDGLLFDALEFPRRFAAKCNDPQLTELLGPGYLKFTARRGQPGLGKPARGTQHEALGYTHAVWASFSHYVYETLAPLREVAASHQTLENSDSLAQQVHVAQASAEANLQAMSAAIALRVLHNRRIECLADRAASEGEESAVGTSAVDDYQWFRIDNDTVSWVVGDDRLPLLTAVWAPYERYAFGESPVVFAGVNEPLTLQMTSANWTRGALDPGQTQFWVTYLLSCLGTRKQGGTESLWLGKSTLDAFRSATNVMDSFASPNCLCGGQQRHTIQPLSAPTDVSRATAALVDWSGIEFWRTVNQPGKHRLQVAPPYLDYRFERVRRAALAELEREHAPHALPRAILRQVAFDPSGDQRAAVASYDGKMELIVNVAGACPEFVEEQTDSSAILDFLDSICRVEPVASPFAPEALRGRIEFSALAARFRTWGGNDGALQKKNAKSRRLAEILMPRMMLLQWRWSESRWRIHEASHTELVHRLEELRSPEPRDRRQRELAAPQGTVEP